jgi:L-iditol 2-dehydrogenase
LAPRLFEEREIGPPPEPGPGEITVRLHAVGICGSDLHWYREGRIGRNYAAFPFVLGHEPSGEVAAAGPGSAFRAGDRVMIEPALSCGKCTLCLAGNQHLCLHNLFMGSPPTPGMFREYATIPACNAVRIPDSLPFDRATMIEPLAVILHTLDLVPVRPGDTVAVIGTGPIGLLTVAAARISGASRIFAYEKNPNRAALARSAGADEAVETEAQFRELVMDSTKAAGADAVYEAAGSSEALNLAMAMAKPGSAVAIIGLTEEKVSQIDLHEALRKEVTLRAIRRSNHNETAALHMLASGRIPEAIVTHHVPLDGVPDAFKMLDDPAGRGGKVIIGIPS